MGERKSFFLLIIIMVAASVLVAGATIFTLHRAAFNEAALRLVETAQSQARLIEAIARFNAAHEITDPGSFPEGPREATLSQIVDAHNHYKGFGETGEFTLSEKVGDNIVFLLSHRHYDLNKLQPVPFKSNLAEPMRRALSGGSGTMVGLDYRGEMVLAAYEPVGELNLGIVAKIDMSEIRAPFVKAGVIAGLFTLVVVLIGTNLFLRISNPIIRELQIHSERLEEMVEERTKKLRDVQDQLIRKEKLSVLGQLAGGVGHELRNPLGVISNAIYYLKMVLPDADETVKEYLDTISSEVDRSTIIVSDLLDLSRSRPAEREQIAVSELINQALDRNSPPDEIEVAIEIPSDLPSLFAEPHQIGQVFNNLIINAYQAMPDGGKLTINAKAQKDKVCLSITDTGSGISEDNKKNLFEPLFTTKARGIGLGLAVSKNLVEANEGNIEVESEEGKGSTFTVILPVKEVLS